MKKFRVDNQVTVKFDDGLTISQRVEDENVISKIFTSKDPKEVRYLLQPNYENIVKEVEKEKEFRKRLKESEYLSVKGDSVYYQDIEVSMPNKLVRKIIEAEFNEDEISLEALINFWIHVCHNPDAKVRNNLFWFLDKYGFTLSQNGLFVAYRNVVTKRGVNSDYKLAKEVSKLFAKIKLKWKKNPLDYLLYFNDGNNRYNIINKNYIHKLNKNKKVIGNIADLYAELRDDNKGVSYTDGYTGTFDIKIGKPVSIPRNQCDSNQNITCSKGLHVAGKSWLESNYFGDTGMMVLVNPADVVAVPPEDSYGKMRTCRYYPVKVVEFDSFGKIIDDDYENGFEEDFLNIIEEGYKLNIEDIDNYKLEEITRELPEELNDDISDEDGIEFKVKFFKL